MIEYPKGLWYTILVVCYLQNRTACAGGKESIMALFVPDIMITSVTDITADFLRSYGIKGLVLDVDNTLTTHGNPTPAPGVLEWLDGMKQAGFQLTIVSNNTHQRVEPFANMLGLSFISMGCKPLTFGMTKACKRFGCRPKEIAVVGDQIFTDILGGNLKGMLTILVTPLAPEHGRFFQLKRRLEGPFIRKYQKRKGGS